MKKPEVIVIGTINIDFVSYVSRFPKIGETLSSNEFQQVPGGKAANQALAIQRLGTQVALIGKVGDDPYAHLLRKKFIEEGILVDHIYTASETSTGNSMILVDDEGQNIIITNQNANKYLTLHEANAALEKSDNAKAAMLQLEMDLDVAHSIIQTLYKCNIPIFLNLAPVMEINSNIRRLVDFLIINEVEASQLTGLPIHDLNDAKLAVQQLLDEDQVNVVLTMGRLGAIVGNKEGINHIPSPEVQPIDTTAAGDCFCGALVVYWLEEQNLFDATKKAVVAASISVTRKGAQPSLPYRKEVEDFINKTRGSNGNEKMD
ncbi:ribokinase [Bacillus sp. DTU_2020_1000418_1_SI_GHA_SEK_038]|uniref:ribokinase n=1 Tax=Bacillus sp. DTU_2020_1000418_1_SI_GHA_SEK_038 TaxID=3077585 RepID=UPI0028ED4225|nr:ribokinase [Bacillus sp. DTU_2020_1000418_1_SI_GHA_SEK_038]WNS73667.1 ribokinase [Bacillus sp. DTU_2020_1000418_1_SI_GHA_SEK_038]